MPTGRWCVARAGGHLRCWATLPQAADAAMSNAAGSAYGSQAFHHGSANERPASGEGEVGIGSSSSFGVVAARPSDDERSRRPKKPIRCLAPPPPTLSPPPPPPPPAVAPLLLFAPDSAIISAATSAGRASRLTALWYMYG